MLHLFKKIGLMVSLSCVLLTAAYAKADELTSSQTSQCFDLNEDQLRLACYDKLFQSPEENTFWNMSGIWKVIISPCLLLVILSPSISCSPIAVIRPMMHHSPQVIPAPPMRPN